MSTVLTRTENRFPRRPGLSAGGIADRGNALSAERLGLDPSDAQAGGRLTLEQRLDSVWEGLRAGGAPDCPVCRAAFEPLRGAPAARCASCGASLC